MGREFGKNINVIRKGGTRRRLPIKRLLAGKIKKIKGRRGGTPATRQPYSRKKR